MQFLADAEIPRRADSGKYGRQCKNRKVQLVSLNRDIKWQQRTALGKWQDPVGGVAPARCSPNSLGIFQPLET